MRVVIVGAGASGLQCANLLISEHGYTADDLLILEARDRVGGRIHTTQEQRISVSGDMREFSLDHGAAWVHGTGLEWGVNPDVSGSEKKVNPMVELLAAATPLGESLYEKHLNHVFSGNPWLRPQTIAHDASSIVLYIGGQRIAKDSPLIPASLGNYFDILDQVSQVGDRMYDQGKGMETTKQSLQETIAQVRIQLPGFSESDSALIERLTDFHLHMIECWEGSSTAELQLCEFTLSSDEDEGKFDEVYTAEGDFYGPHCTMRNGMETVLKPLLTEDIVSRIRLKESVTKISSKDNLVTVKTSTGLTIHADSCVVTMTVGCLQDAIGNQQLFQPTLSKEKLEAIGVMRMGSYKKVFLTFDHIFWSPKEAILGMVRKTDRTGDDPLENTLLFDNLWALDGIPCIEAVLVGNVGHWFTHKSDDEIRNAVLEFMQEATGFVGNLGEHCVDCHVTRWEEDPYSKGSYSHMSLGALSRHVDELGRPEWDGRLVLAGEATVLDYEGSVHAALISGRNAAQSVALGRQN